MERPAQHREMGIQYGLAVGAVGVETRTVVQTGPWATVGLDLEARQVAGAALLDGAVWSWWNEDE